ncbi:SGNH/GDSL hydrolase family protein [Halodurantibacterium flavum]|uniref:SGNH/GDSL hydrolase family protein n=1 Tax=Halodurantibacterium flavum TaxID=1382802 RepID=A0ABW4S623_9RHOB
MSDTRTVTGVLRTRSGQPFANKTMTWSPAPRRAVAREGVGFVDERFFSVTGADGAVNVDVVPGQYLVMVSLADADRYIQVTIPEGEGTFNIADGMYQEVPATPSEPWETTRILLRSFLSTTSGAANPHSQGAMPAPPTVVTGAGGPAAPAAPYDMLTKSYRYAAGTLANVARFDGGGGKPYFTDYRRFPVATRAATGGNANDGEDAVSWRAGFVVDAAALAFRVVGSSVFNYRMIVDGRYVSVTPTSMTTGGRQYIVLDFGTKAVRVVQIEGSQAAALDGIHIAPADTVTRLEEAPFGALMFGDSFTGATGVPAGRDGDGLAVVAGDHLGLPLWASGVGGSGYVATAGGTVFALPQRIGTDIQRYVDEKGAPPQLVIVAMGINDIGSGGIAPAAATCFDIIRNRCPAALVFVLGPWDRAAPLAPDAGYAEVKASIITALTGRTGFFFIDSQGIDFTKSDATHPDAAGHQALGVWLNGRIRSLVAQT